MERRMNTRINDKDMHHLHAFPDTRKAAVIHKMMSHEPAQSVVLNGNTDFEKTVLKLHRDGFGLIDLQPQETAFSAVWYRKGGTLLPWAREQVAMLLWEAPEQSTTLMTWQV